MILPPDSLSVKVAFQLYSFQWANPINDLVSCTSLGGINIRMLFLGFVYKKRNQIIEMQETRSLKFTLSQPAHPITYIYMNLRLQLNSQSRTQSMPVRRLGAGHDQHLTCEQAYSGYEIAQQLASVAQLVRALHRNRRAVGSIRTRGPCAAFFAAVPDQFLKCIYTHLDYTNPKKQHPNQAIDNHPVKGLSIKICSYKTFQYSVLSTEVLYR